MKKDQLLEEFKKMEVSNLQEFYGGDKLIPYDTHYTSKKVTYVNGQTIIQDVDDVATDYYNPEFVSDTTILHR